MGKTHTNEYCILLKIRGVDKKEVESDTSFVGEEDLDESDIKEI